MMKLSIRGLPEVIALGDIDVLAVLDPVVQRGSRRLEQRLTAYPSAPAGSSYQRTYQLKRGWGSRFTRSGRGVVSETSNDTPYVQWVQGEEMQARVHRGRWGTDADAVDLSVPEIAQDALHAFEVALR